MNVDAIELHPGRGGLPRAAEKIDAVASRNDPAEDLSEVKLGATRLGILVILPVEDEYPH
jgi:hypothetical protein